MGAILEQGEVEGWALRTSTNVSWTQHRHGLDIKGVCALANHLISLVFPSRCMTKTFGVRPRLWVAKGYDLRAGCPMPNRVESY